MTYGAGALNMLNAVASAYAEKVARRRGVRRARDARADRGLLKLHHQAKTLDSQIPIYREITCAQARLDDPRRAPADIARVLSQLHHAFTPGLSRDSARPGRPPCEPVAAVEAPAGDAEAVSRLRRRSARRASRAARPPVMMLGVEVRRFGLEAQVAELARTLGIPVVTTFMGRGLLAGTDSPLVGTYLGTAGDPAITRLVEDSDACCCSA